MLFTVKGRMYVREGNPYLDLLTQSEAAAQNLGCHIELGKLRQSSANVALMLYQRQRRWYNIKTTLHQRSVHRCFTQ